MGSRKTTNQIERINERTSQQRCDAPLLVILPLLTEAKRYMGGCPGEHFCEPVDYYDQNKKQYVSKTQALLSLLTEGKSIVTTHALFSLFTPEIKAEIKKQNYEVIIDEEVTTFKPLKISRQQKRELKKLEYLEIDPITKQVRWVGPEDDEEIGTNEYRMFKKEILSGNAFALDNESIFIIQIPADFFKIVDNYVILTYLFECSDLCAYFHLNNIKYTINKQNNDEVKKIKKKISSLVEIIDSPKAIQKISKNRRTHFSNNWWVSRKPSELKKIRDNVGDYLKRRRCTKEELLYACPKEISTSQEDITKKGRHVQLRGYKDCWIPFNSKATNEYSNKSVIIYMQNVYPNVNIDKYLKEKGELKTKEIEDERSLSVMLQCIWRTRIRKGQKIQVMFFSDRMREMFERWVNN